MLKIKDKYDYRQELCEALRSSRHTQLRASLGNFRDPSAPTCFQGVAHRTFKTLYWRDKLGFTYETEAHIVHNLNDSWGWSFPQIASYIESLP